MMYVGLRRSIHTLSPSNQAPVHGYGNHNSGGKCYEWVERPSHLPWSYYSDRARSSYWREIRSAPSSHDREMLRNKIV